MHFWLYTNPDAYSEPNRKRDFFVAMVKFDLSGNKSKSRNTLYVYIHDQLKLDTCRLNVYRAYLGTRCYVAMMCTISCI